jgi:hypothetical protein
MLAIYYYLFLSYCITDKGRTGSAWKRRGVRGTGWELGAGVKITQTMYIHVNK